MSCVTAVDGEWLAELGPMFFSIKESFETTLRRRHEKKVEQARMQKEMDEKKDDEEKNSETVQTRKDTVASSKRQRVATPGRGSTTPRFAPRSRGRLGI